MALFCVISANSGTFRAYCVKVHVRYLICWWVLVITANMQSETGFPSSRQLKSYVASKSRLKLAARCPVSGCWPSCSYSCAASWQDFNWLRASRGPPAIAVLPVTVTLDHELNVRTELCYQNKPARQIGQSFSLIQIYSPGAVQTD